jgi:hypothetical protein
VVARSSRLVSCNCLNLAWNLTTIVIDIVLKVAAGLALVIPKKKLAFLPTGLNLDNCKNEKSAFCFVHWYFNSF